MRCKFVLLTLFVFIGIMSLGAVSAAESTDDNCTSNVTTTNNPEIAPLNPDFGSYNDGLTSSPLDFSQVTGKIYQDDPSFPTSFDLRDTGKVTPVKDQNPLGTCWTFATCGSLESCLLPGETADFSENNLKNMLSNAYPDGFDRDYAAGGNYEMSTAYLARWSGPVNESDDPYNTQNGNSPTGLSPVKHVQNVSIIPNRTGPLDNDNIKWALMNYGAVASNMYWDESYYSPANYSYYFNLTSGINHAICIVGWDDNYDKNNFSITPPGNGAFIIKNSWSTMWGENGYFYISYYDSVLANNVGGGGFTNYVFHNADSTANYNKIYQYDPLGWTGSTGYSNPTGWFSNIFTSTGNDKLAAASFYVYSTNSSYELYVYLNPTTDNPRSGTMVASKTGTLMPGYRTVALDLRIPLTTGQKFSVVVKLTTPGYNLPIAIEIPNPNYSSKATANSGESYISSNGINWTDVNTSHSNTNVCLKAFTVGKLDVYPGDSIQATIDNAVDGETVTVHGNNGDPWTYIENITIDRLITLISAADGAVTIQALNPNLPVITAGSGSTIQGFTITGATSSDGIGFDSADSCQLIGNIIKGNHVGIKLYNSHNNTISSNIIENNAWSGICLDQSTGNTINNNNVIYNNQEGVFIANNSNSNTISGNNIHENTGIGISILSTSNDNTISSNTVNTNGVMGIFIQNSNNNIVSGNTVQNNSWTGICLDHATSNTINGSNQVSGNQEGVFLANTSSNNNISHNNIHDNAGTGLSILTGSTLNTVEYNTAVSHNGVMGVFIQNSNYNSISSNTIQNNIWAGICLDGSSGVNIGGYNIITGNQEGIFIANNSHTTTIYENNIYNNTGNGINILNSNDCDIVYNHQINNNGVSGIFIQNSTDTEVHHNILTSNGWGGIILDTANNTTVHNNNFYTNYEQALAVNGSENTFYQGTSGNYWSDWTPKTDPRPIDGNENLYDQYPSTIPYLI